MPCLKCVSKASQKLCSPRSNCNDRFQTYSVFVLEIDAGFEGYDHAFNKNSLVIRNDPWFFMPGDPDAVTGVMGKAGAVMSHRQSQKMVELRDTQSRLYPGNCLMKSRKNAFEMRFLLLVSRADGERVATSLPSSNHGGQ